ncbi:MAG: hypothetical protein EOS08_29430 [Mesorhizobium sp.]|nr:MAG: hypothetical protein EOS08_29430 [Mesorhizobium sp.]
MANDFTKYPSSTETTPAGLFEHWCEHPGCTKWGGWGFPRGKQTVWFCWKHREDAEELRPTRAI